MPNGRQGYPLIPHARSRLQYLATFGYKRYSRGTALAMPATITATTPLLPNDEYPNPTHLDSLYLDRGTGGGAPARYACGTPPTHATPVI